MAAGGFKEFVAGETLDEDDINDFLMQGVLVFAGTAARGSAVTAPVEGQFSFLKDTDTVEFYDSTQWVEFAGGLPVFDFLVIGGGGGGGAEDTGAANSNGGGGAGGYRCSVSGETSGGGVSAEVGLSLATGGTVTVTVGAGGAGANKAAGTRGSDSVFASVVAVGGGGAHSNYNTLGGSGAGNDARFTSTTASGVSRNGFAGGLGNGASIGGGGGGASEAGNTDGTGFGGDGVASSITGSSVTRGGGGGGGGPASSGGDGGGGDGATAAPGDGSAATVNTGGGGGGSRSVSNLNNSGANGGSGFVVLKYPNSITLTIGAGLTSSTSTSGDFKITEFTAGTDTVTIG